MVKNGLEVSLVSAGKIEVISGVTHYSIPLKRDVSWVRDLYCLWLLTRLIYRLKPTIVHTHTPKAGLLGMLAAKFANVPIRIHTVGGLPFMTASGWYRYILIRMERLTAWAAHHVWPNSFSLFTFMKQERLCPEIKMSIIAQGSTNGVDLEVFSPNKVSLERVQTAQAAIQFNPDFTYLMSIGRIVKDKGIPELVAAFLQLHRNRPDLRLILVGPIEKVRNEEILPEATIRHIQENAAIITTGWTDDVPSYLSIADVLIHASHREGFPNAPLQAGAMSVPIICSDIPGNIDIVKHGYTGCTYPAGDISALSRAIQAFLDNRTDAKVMASRLRIRIEQYYDQGVIHQAILDKYQLLLANNDN